jgi:hypothetical protein
MSLAVAVARLNDLADDLERDAIGIAGFTAELLGYAEAFEHIAERFTEEPWGRWHDLRRAIDSGQEASIDVHTLVTWLRMWTARLPCDS